MNNTITIQYRPGSSSDLRRGETEGDFERRAEKDACELITLLSKNGYDVSMSRDEFCLIIEYGYSDIELAEHILRWLTPEEDDELRTIRAAELCDD